MRNLYIYKHIGGDEMLQEFWSYFMTTGQIDTYMNYKAYEETQKTQHDV